MFAKINGYSKHSRLNVSYDGIVRMVLQNLYNRQLVDRTRSISARVPQKGFLPPCASTTG